MYIKILLNYILGYVNIEIEGYYIERFINLCKSNKILLWGSKRKKTTLFTTNIGISDFRKIKYFFRKTKCRLKIKRKRGLPFIFHRYKQRKIFIFFFLLVTMGIFFLTNFIWNIEIIGNNKISKDDIIKSLNNQNVKVGVLKNKINTQEIVNKVRLERNDLAWIGIELKGTNLIVKIVEADKKPEIINEEEYCNIVATKDGIIDKIDAVNGTALVKEGDVVKKGDALIGGWIEGKYTGNRYVHSNGHVRAKVWYIEEEEVKLKDKILNKNGNFESKYSVKINNFIINFYKTLSKFENYDTIEESKKLKIFSDIYLPIEIVKKVNYELDEKNVEYTIDEAKKIAEERAKEKLDKKVLDKENIVNTYIKFDETEDVVKTQVIYEVLEEIGTKEKIVF